ncbi:MAG: DUF1801 domain-containing protein [Bacteroidota bacterium]
MMQDFNVTIFINQQPKKLRNILIALRNIIFQAALHIEESMKYGIPFYNYYGRLCFLSPRKETVMLGLCKGAFLGSRHAVLVGEGKEVRHIEINNLAEIDQEALQTLLQEAMLLNELAKKRKD